MSLIELKKICKTYQHKHIQTAVLRELDLQVEEGEFICILGASGSGKSTLLNIIGLLDNFEAGEYCLQNENVASLSDTRQAQIRNQLIGFVFQNFLLIPELNVWQNVAMPLGYAKVSKSERKQQALSLLDKFELSHLANKRVERLSGGEQQRVALLRAIINKPKLLLADEPTGNLDQHNTEMVMAMLHELHKNNTTILMVTHDSELTHGVDRILHIEAGKIIEEKR